MLTNLLNNVVGGAHEDWMKWRKVLLNKILFAFIKYQIYVLTYLDMMARRDKEKYILLVPISSIL